jgi:hypothetical protein
MPISPGAAWAAAAAIMAILAASTGVLAQTQVEGGCPAGLSGECK